MRRRDAVTRRARTTTGAALILTLDGIFVSFVAASAFRGAADLRATTSQFGAETWVLLALMAASLASSIVSAVVALRSRLHPPSAVDDDLRARGVDLDDDVTYAPAVTWFFQHVASLRPEVLARALARADADFSVRALAEAVVPLSRNVVVKHRWVNRGFVFAGAVLLFFLSAAAS